jgi:predicted TIM-barrel fold metal-dependent hydrolase
MLPLLLSPEGKAAETAERFLADVNRIGSDRLVEDGLTESAALLQKYPDRIFWGTDLGPTWHFEDSVTGMVIKISREFIGKLPTDVQEKYAYKNAQRVFGRFLTPNP